MFSVRSFSSFLDVCCACIFFLLVFILFFFKCITWRNSSIIRQVTDIRKKVNDNWTTSVNLHVLMNRTSYTNERISLSGFLSAWERWLMSMSSFDQLKYIIFNIFNWKYFHSVYIFNQVENHCNRSDVSKDKDTHARARTLPRTIRSKMLFHWSLNIDILFVERKMKNVF